MSKDFELAMQCAAELKRVRDRDGILSAKATELIDNIDGLVGAKQWSAGRNKHVTVWPEAVRRQADVFFSNFRGQEPRCYRAGGGAVEHHTTACLRRGLCDLTA